MSNEIKLIEEWKITQKEHHHSGGVKMVAFSHEFDLMCTIANPEFGKSDNSVHVFKLNSDGHWNGKKPKKLKCPDTSEIAQIAICKLTDKVCLITCIYNGFLVFWKISPEGKSIGKPTIIEETGYYMLALTRLNNGKVMIATGEIYGGISTWTFDEEQGLKGPILLDEGLGEEIYQDWDREHPIDRRVLNNLSLCPFEKGNCLILAEARESSVKLRLLDYGGKSIRDPIDLGGFGSPCTAVSLSLLPNNGMLLASGWNKGNIQLRKLYNKGELFEKEAQTLTGHTGAINSLSSCILANGVILLASSGKDPDFLHSNPDETVRIWELNSQGTYEDKDAYIIEGYHDYDSNVAWCPLKSGGAVLATTIMNEQSLRLFRFQS